MSDRVDRNVFGDMGSGGNGLLKCRRASKIEELVTTGASGCESNCDQCLVDGGIHHYTAVIALASGEGFSAIRGTAQSAAQRRTVDQVNVGIVGDAYRGAGGGVGGARIWNVPGHDRSRGGTGAKTADG